MRRSRLSCLAVGILAMALLGAACASSSSTTPGESGSSSGAAFTTLKPGIIQVGSCLDYKPFESIPAGSKQPVGFDIDMTDAIAAKLGLKVQWVKAGFNTIFTAVAAHKFDMVAAAVTATGKLGNQRSQTVSFSNFYYDSEQSFSVNTNKTPTLTNTDQLKPGDVVGVQQGTTGAAWAIANLQPKGIQIKEYPLAPTAFTDLEAGNITGVINDAPSSAVEVKGRAGLKLVEGIPTHERYAFAFPQDNPGLVAAWNKGLQEVIASGEYSKIFLRWFPGVPVPNEYQGTSSAP